MLNQLGTNKALYAGLCSDEGGATEISGGSPAYARKAVTWGAASGGVLTMNGTDPVFDVPAGTVGSVAFYDAVTAGNQIGFYNVTNEVFAAQGTYTITDATITLA
ncbi:MAG: hypothetical protein AB9888_08060 [Bacteroidales bacterium]